MEDVHPASSEAVLEVLSRHFMIVTSFIFHYIGMVVS